MTWSERRWALRHMTESGPFLVGRYCWKECRADDRPDQIPIRTFQTRQAARDARKTCCYQDVVVVPVTLQITVEP